MARTDNLTNFLTDVASAIKEKKGTTDLIQPKDFDTEIQGIAGGKNRIKTILQAYAEDSAQNNIVPRTIYDITDSNTDYLVFDETTHKWTVQQDFEGYIVIVVRTYRDSNTLPNVSIFINDENIYTCYSNGTAVGQYGVGKINYSFKKGDNFYFGKNNSLGWDAPYVYIFLNANFDAILEGIEIADNLCKEIIKQNIVSVNLLKEYEINNGVMKINASQSSINNKTINDLFAKYQEISQINFKDTQVIREEFYNYTELEYLETTKTQYIDTKIKYNDNYKIGIDFLVKDTDANDSVICGSKDWGGNGNILTIEYGYILRNYYPSSPVDYSFAPNQRKQIEIFRGQIICDNIVQAGNDNINPSAEENAANIHIFSDNNGGHLINYAKLYSFYIYDTITNSYVMNAFPVLDNDGIPCLYDTVTKKYYYNQGTGDFLFA